MSNINDSEINSRKYKHIINDKNRIKLFRRTNDNYTHEDISDKKISKITSWRKSKKKFLSVLFLNILSLGILHIISKCYPKLYLKLYCNNCSPKYSDFFLIEDKYGQCTLCQTKIIKKNNDYKNNSLEESSKGYMSLLSSWNINNLKLNLDNDISHNYQNAQYININHSHKISFIYNSKMYEYDETQNMIFPVHLNLKGTTNKNIINIFQGGLSSDYLVKLVRERFGKNEYKINNNLMYIYFQKIEKKLLIYSIIFGSLEIAIQDAVSTSIIISIIIIFFIFRKIFLSLLLNKYDNQDYTIDGETAKKLKVKRKYLFKKIKNIIINKFENSSIDKESKKSNNNNSNYYNNNSNSNSNYNNIYDINKENNNKEENNYDYVEIDNSDLLPGDIIYLQKGDYVPCDGIILEGECIINEIELNEILSHTFKSFLKYTNDIFDYKTNKNNVLLHGMKISKVFKKRNISGKNEYITVLCINTGPNTYKANQITNALDLLKRKKIYQNMYKIFSGQRLIFIIIISILFFLTVLVPTILMILKIKKEGIISLSALTTNRGNNNSMNPNSNGKPSQIEKGGLSPYQSQTMEKKSQSISEEVRKEILKGLIINYIMNFLIRALIKSYMPIYFIISSIIILLGSYRLYKNNIFCFEKMRILFAGEINTIFMSKVNILSNDKYEIKAYYPAFQESKTSNVSLQTYSKDQIKDFSTIIFSYYNNIKNNKESFVGLTNITSLNKISGKLSVRLLECLFCCNNLIKIGHKIQGNMIEKNLFKTMKWEIKVVEEENSNNNFENYITEVVDNNHENDQFEFSNSESNSNLFYYGSDKEEKYNYTKIMDVYPKNYYKMLDKKNFGYQKLISRFKFFLSKEIFRTNTKRSSSNISDNNSFDSNKSNPILKDLANTKCSSYKLRIYKKFLTKNSLFSSAIVYNFLLKTLNFMTKGSPEKILQHCLLNSLPDDICKIISELRKDGYIIIICASKKLDLYSYNDSKNESFYMKDLIFCGLITLKNKINKDSKIAIEELQKKNCEIIMNTGDNLYNSIGTGFEIGILDNKKIFSFDLDDNQNILYVNNIYRPFSFNYEIYEQFNEVKRTIRKSIKYFRKENRKGTSNSKNNSKVKNNTNDNIKEKNNTNNNSNSLNTTSLIDKDKDLKKLQDLNKCKYKNKNRNSQIPIMSPFSKMTNNGDSFFSSERVPVLNRSSTYKIDEDNNNSELKKRTSNQNNINNINNINKKYSNNTIKKKIFTPKKINNLRSYISLDNKIIKKLKDSIIIKNNDKKYSVDKTKSNYSNMITGSNDLEYDECLKEELIRLYFSNICHYSESFLNYLEKDSIFCVSGKAFKFIYNNKDIYSDLLNLLSKKTKIFFSMTSQDKSLLIDYYRESSNKKTCMVGHSTIDIDAMMTAHVGICLKKPNSLNMILCHFYLPSKNIIDIKTIIEFGRVIVENVFLLFISSVFCTAIINLYMGISFHILMDVKPEHLRVFNLMFYFLSLFGFTNSGDNNKCSLKQNHKLFVKFIIIQFIGNFIIKIYDIVIFFVLYKKNKNIDDNKRDIIFLSYLALLSINQIFSTLFGFNYIRFYRKVFYNNFWFCISLIIFSFIGLNITCLSRPGLHSFTGSIFIFENLQVNSDTFDDRNKLEIFLIIIIDLLITLLFITITQYYFNKISTKIYENENNKNALTQNDIYSEKSMINS